MTLAFFSASKTQISLEVPSVLVEGLLHDSVQAALNRAIARTPDMAGLQALCVSTESGSFISADILRVSIDDTDPRLCTEDIEAGNREAISSVGLFCALNAPELSMRIDDTLLSMDSRLEDHDRIKVWIFPEGIILTPVGPDPDPAATLDAQAFLLLVESGRTNHEKADAYDRAGTLCDRLSQIIGAQANRRQASFVPLFVDP